MTITKSIATWARYWSLAATVLALVVAAPHAASAQEVTGTVIPSPDPAKDEPSQIDITVISESGAPPVEKITLVQIDQKKEISIPASGLKTFIEGSETLGVVVVVEGHEVWIGNSYAEDEASKFPGVYKQLTLALEGLNKAGPRGSKAVMITYGRGFGIPFPAGDLANVTGDKIGTEKEFAGVVARDLVAGVTEGIAQVNKLTASRKVMIVIGDGMDTNQEQGQAQLLELGKKLGNDHVDVYAIFVPAPEALALDADPNGYNKLTKKVTRLTGIDGLPAAISKVVDEIDDRYYIRFPGADIKLKKSFTWDENPHAFKVMLDKDEFDLSNELSMSPKWVPPWMRKKKGWPWWLFVLIPVAAILLIVVAVKVIFKKKEPEPEPVYEAPVVVAAPVAVPAAMPAGPMKTVMIGIGGDDQGFPVVGWIVPLNGPNQFQTFKLQGGATKIGTGGAAHIVVNDGFMSTEHAQIVASPHGFMLVDGGSTNGTQVNERRVDKHELVDNDIIMMGKTNFRFKSIN